MQNLILVRGVRQISQCSWLFGLVFLLSACSQTQAPVKDSHRAPLPEFRSAAAPAPFVHPVPTGRISSSFANYVVASRNRKHHGVDFAAPVGTPVYAASSGVVLSADMGSLSEDFGLAVLIEHGDKFQSLSAHLSRIDVNIGDWVQAGQQIGLVGKTGRVTGAHLHFELWQNSIPKDPLLFLPIKAPPQPIAAVPLRSPQVTPAKKSAKPVKVATAKQPHRSKKAKKSSQTRTAAVPNNKPKQSTKQQAKSSSPVKPVKDAGAAKAVTPSAPTPKP